MDNMNILLIVVVIVVIYLIMSNKQENGYFTDYGTPYTTNDKHHCYILVDGGKKVYSPKCIYTIRCSDCNVKISAWGKPYMEGCGCYKSDRDEKDKVQETQYTF